MFAGATRRLTVLLSALALGAASPALASSDIDADLAQEILAELRSMTS